MGYEQRLGDIAIFREREKKNERAPDWKGSMIVPEGVKPGDKLDVAVWAKTETMLAGQVQIPRAKGDFPSGGGQPQRSGDDRGGSGGVSGGGRDDPRGAEPFDDIVPFVVRDSIL